jgi:hypothetical protein
MRNIAYGVIISVVLNMTLLNIFAVYLRPQYVYIDCTWAGVNPTLSLEVKEQCNRSASKVKAKR